MQPGFADPMAQARPGRDAGRVLRVLALIAVAIGLAAHHRGRLRAVLLQHSPPRDRGQRLAAAGQALPADLRCAARAGRLLRARAPRRRPGQPGVQLAVPARAARRSRGRRRGACRRRPGAPPAGRDPGRGHPVGTRPDRLRPAARAAALRQAQAPRPAVRRGRARGRSGGGTRRARGDRQHDRTAGSWEPARLRSFPASPGRQRRPDPERHGDRPAVGTAVSSPAAPPVRQRRPVRHRPVRHRPVRRPPGQAPPGPVAQPAHAAVRQADLQLKARVPRQPAGQQPQASPAEARHAPFMPPVGPRPTPEAPAGSRPGWSQPGRCPRGGWGRCGGCGRCGGRSRCGRSRCGGRGRSRSGRGRSGRSGRGRGRGYASGYSRGHSSPGGRNCGRRPGHSARCLRQRAADEPASARGVAGEHRHGRREPGAGARGRGQRKPAGRSQSIRAGREHRPAEPGPRRPGSDHIDHGSDRRPAATAARPTTWHRPTRPSRRPA